MSWGLFIPIKLNMVSWPRIRDLIRMSVLYMTRAFNAILSWFIKIPHSYFLLLLSCIGEFKSNRNCSQILFLEGMLAPFSGYHYPRPLILETVLAPKNPSANWPAILFWDIRLLILPTPWSCKTSPRACIDNSIPNNL